MYGFQTGGRYQSKEDALWIYLGTIFGLGILNPFIYQFWSSFGASVDPTTPIGLILAGGIFMVNRLVTHWNQTDPKSLTIYFVSAVLIFVV